MTAETATLVRVEDEFDEVYSRYGGRQIVRRGEARATELAAGSLFVPLEGEAALRAALVLEPAQLYGLYQYPRFKALAGMDGSLPVLRVVHPEGGEAVSGIAGALDALLAEEIPPIDHVDLFLVRLPFVSPFAISTAVWTTKDALLLRLESGGVTAWGECVADPDPFYAYETTGTARHVLKDFLLPLLSPGGTLGELERRMRHVRGHEMARATLENAVLDLIAKRKGIPLHALLGAPRKKIPSGISIGIQDSPAALVAAVADAVAKKYHRVKMKIQKGRDLDYVRAVRDRFPDLPLMVDANGDYRLDDAAHLARLDAFSLTMIEQPLSYSDLYQHALLQKSLKTPLCLDESIHSLDDAAAAIALGGCRILNLKQGRVGGLLESMRILEHASARGVPVWSGGWTRPASAGR